ncbi:MAG: hypothetical protein AAFR65_08695 [Pseudomonadota bacterium]
MPGAFGVYGGRARAQVLPAGCTDALTSGTPNDGNGSADAGETVTCLSPPTPIGSVSGNAEDLTIVVGSSATPTSIATSGMEIIGVNLTGGGTVHVRNPSSTVYGSYNGVYLGNVVSPGTDLELMSEGTITSDTLGAVATRNSGTGTTSITVVDVSSNNGAGIESIVEATATDLTIVSTGTVQGETNGIDVQADGIGAVDITVGYVTGAAGDGINVTSGSTATNINITSTGLVQGQVDGLDVYHQGTGALVISAYEVGGTTGYGVYARNTTSAAGDVSVSVSGGVNVSASAGISALNRGSGGLFVSSGGLASSGVGINASNTTASAQDLTVVATRSVSGSSRGIEASHSGAGDLVIDVFGVTATGGAGSYALVATSGPASGAMSITSQTSNYGGDSRIYGGGGVRAAHGGAGPLTINVTSVESSSATAIDVTTSSATTGDVTITASGAIAGATTGIDVDHDGSGAVTLDLAGAVGGTTFSDFGARVENTSSGGAMTVTSSGMLTGGYAGVQASQLGSGGLTINLAGATGVAQKGVSAFNLASTEGLSITSSDDIIGVFQGIDVRNDFGDLTIDVVDVVADDCIICSAINVFTRMDAEDVDIAIAGDVDGGRGVEVDHLGTGDITVTLGSSATVTGATEEGVYASTFNASADVIVQGSSGDIVGATDGVYLSTAGGDITVRNLDSVTGQAGDGIDVRSAGGAISISAVDTVLGTGGSGIYANSGGGDISIQGVGLVGGIQGTSVNGIFATAAGGTGGVVDIGGTTAVGDLTGPVGGIAAFTDGNGAITISVAGSVTAGTAPGVFASNAGAGDTAISVGDVSSTGAFGVFAYNDTRAGGMSISSAGTVTGTEGVYALQYGTGDLTVSVQNAVGTTDDAIDVLHTGAGSVEVVATGTLTGADDGLDATVSNGDLTITTTGTVMGGQAGIEAYNFGMGATTISVSGDVTGETEDGILVVASSGGSVSVAQGVTVTGDTASIVFIGDMGPADSGNDVVSLAETAALVGDLFFHAGDDTFNDASGQFTMASGGDGVDTLNFSGPFRILTNSGGAGDSVREFEVFNFNTGGITLAGTHTGLSEANFNAGRTVLTGSLEASAAFVAAGATLNAQDGASLIGSLTNNGALDVGSSPGTFTIDGDLLLGSTGLLSVELGAESDQVVVTGAVTLGGTLDVAFPDGRSLGTSTFSIIEGASAVSGAFDQIPTSGLLVQSEVEVDDATSDVIFTSTVLLPSTLDSLTEDQSSLGDTLFRALTGPTVDAELNEFITAIGVKESETEVAAALQDVSPEGADMGLRLMLDAQNGFSQAIMDADAAPAGSDQRYSVWGDIQINRVDQGSGSDMTFDGGRLSFFSGVNVTLQSGWSFGFAGGVTAFDAESDDVFGGLTPGDDVDGEVFHVDGGVRRPINTDRLGMQIDGVVSYAQGNQDLTMLLIDPFTDGRFSQSADVDLSSADLSLRLMLNRWGQNSLPLRPFVELGAEFYTQDDFTIGDARPSGLHVEEVDNNRTRTRLGTDFMFDLRDRLLVQGRVAGVQYFGDTENVFMSQFSSSQSGESFSVSGNDVQTQLEIAGNIAYTHRSGAVFSVEAGTSIGDIDAYGAQVQISKRF